MDFDSAPGAGSVAVMENEADKLLKPSGISLDWRLAKENHGDHPFAGLVVLKFKGVCSVEGWSGGITDFGSLGEERPLGSTRVSHGKVLPYTEVRCDEVRKALAYLRPDADRAERQRALGLALGRVVAHEIYHILAKTTGHAAHGLAKATQSLEDLVTGSELPFAEGSSRAITEGLREGM